VALKKHRNTSTGELGPVHAGNKKRGISSSVPLGDQDPPLGLLKACKVGGDAEQALRQYFLLWGNPKGPKGKCKNNPGTMAEKSRKTGNPRRGRTTPFRTRKKNQFRSETGEGKKSSPKRTLLKKKRNEGNKQNDE